VPRFRATPSVAAWAAAVLVVAGFVAIVISWRGAAATASIALQMPFVVSGAFAGLGLVVFGATLAHIELTRRLAAEEEAALRTIVDSAARTVISLRDTAPTSAPPAPAAWLAPAAPRSRLAQARRTRLPRRR
jgi:hypothetical protein